MIYIKIGDKQLLSEGKTIDQWKAEEALRAIMDLHNKTKNTSNIYKPILRINPDTGAFSFHHTHPSGKIEVNTPLRQSETLPGQRSAGSKRPITVMPAPGVGPAKGLDWGNRPEPKKKYGAKRPAPLIKPMPDDWDFKKPIPPTPGSKKTPSVKPFTGAGYTMPLRTIEVLSNGNIVINSNLAGHYSADDLRKLDADGILPKRWVNDYQSVLDEISDMVETQSKGWRGLANSKEFRLAKGETLSLARRIANRIKTTIGLSWNIVIDRLDPTSKIYRRQMSAIALPPLTQRGRNKMTKVVDADMNKVKRDLAKARAKNVKLMNTPGTPEKKIVAQGQRAQKLRESLEALKDLKELIESGAYTKKTLGQKLKRAGQAGARGLGKLAGWLMLPADAVVVYQALQDAQMHGATPTESAKMVYLSQGHSLDSLGELLFGWAGYQNDWFVHEEFFTLHAMVLNRYYLAWSKVMFLKKDPEKIPIGTKTPGGPWTAAERNTLRRVKKYQESGVDLVDPAMRKQLGDKLRGFMKKIFPAPKDSSGRSFKPDSPEYMDPTRWNVPGLPMDLQESKNFQRSKNKIKIKINS